MSPQSLEVNFKTDHLERSSPAVQRRLPEPPPAAERADLPKASILMVDDTPENLIALEAVLADLGQNLVKASSGEEALRLLLRQEFAVILLDVNMPGLNGFETAEMIRQRKSTEHIPIIFVSAISTSDTHLFKGYSLGAVDYIFTPVIPEVLRSKVSVFVELLKKTEETKQQAEQLRQIELREHHQRLNEAAQRIQLQTKQNRFFTLSVDLMAIADFKGWIKESNPAWQRVLGFSEAELRGCPVGERMGAADRVQLERAIRDALKDQRPAHFEAEYPCKDGECRCFSWTVAPYPAEELLYLYGRDITEARRAGNEIRKLNSDLADRAAQLQAANAELGTEIVTRKMAEAALQESNSALETFSFSVSHDLRAPLRAMQGFARVLLEDYSSVLDEMGKECALRISSAAERMDSLVNDLLIYSRLGHTDLDLADVPLQEVVADALGQLEEEIKRRGCKVEVAEPLPRAKAHALTLAQAIMNLLSNGMKFVECGKTPCLRLWAEQKGGHVTVWVEDNGIGIAEENKAKIFRVFERLHSADEFPGTGLGLAIVRKGIERMGGQVGVESKPGQGSRFWIRLNQASR